VEDGLDTGWRIEGRAKVGELDLVDIHPDDRHPRPRIDCLDLDFTVDEGAIVGVADNDVEVLGIVTIDEPVDEVTS
jgi:hypothetical protein